MEEEIVSNRMGDLFVGTLQLREYVQEFQRLSQGLEDSIVYYLSFPELR